MPGLTSALARPLAHFTRRRLRRVAADPHAAQARVLARLRDRGRRTAFGRDHDLAYLLGHDDLARRVPIRDYEGLRPYVDRALAGESDVLWPGHPSYFAKTSGTTSGAKYVPITRESLPSHFGTARDALMNYYARTGHGDWLDGKMIFLSGSPELETRAGIPTGRLSGISNHLIPSWAKRNQLPSYPTNCIEDWPAKVDAIVAETVGQDLRLISGIPPWVQMYFERLLAATGASSVSEVFPNFSVLVYGGVNYEPYRAQLERLIGGPVPSVETYPASEGFVAFQDGEPGEGLLLNVDAGIYFEFVPLAQANATDPPRLSLRDVELGKRYALVLTTTAGLWAYAIGDVVEFVSLTPYRIRVAGRVAHFISAFGEHVIGAEVEAAMREATGQHGGRVTEFTVAPQVAPAPGDRPHHEWLVEFAEPPTDLSAFAKTLDAALRARNIYYADLRDGDVLRAAELTVVSQGGFRKYMARVGKLGGQNKVPRLADDRRVADGLLNG